VADEPDRPPYAALAAVYDRWTADNAYGRWVEFAERRWRELGVRADAVLDVCCGTGTVAKLLRDRGARVVGVDCSPEMLERAADKLGPATPLVRQDVRRLDLPDRFDAAVWLFDSANYLLTLEELEEALRRIGRHLRPGGALIFDVNTPHKLRTLFGDSSYGEDHDEFAYIWKNSFDADRATCTYDITLFVAAEGAFVRHRERHVQRAYESRALEEAIERAGLTLAGCYDDYGEQPPHAESMRLVFVAARPGGS
jgi:SAM-dependent methyltransferase